MFSILILTFTTTEWTSLNRFLSFVCNETYHTYEKQPNLGRVNCDGGREVYRHKCCNWLQPFVQEHTEITVNFLQGRQTLHSYSIITSVAFKVYDPIALNKSWDLYKSVKYQRSVLQTLKQGQTMFTITNQAHNLNFTQVFFTSKVNFIHTPWVIIYTLHALELAYQTKPYYKPNRPYMTLSSVSHKQSSQSLTKLCYCWQSNFRCEKCSWFLRSPFLTFIWKPIYNCVLDFT